MATVDQITRHDDSDPDDDVWVRLLPSAGPIDIDVTVADSTDEST